MRVTAILTALLLFMAMPGSHAADTAPAISISHQSCHSTMRELFREDTCGKFDMDISPQGVVTMHGDYCKRDEPCTGTMPAEDIRNLRNYLDNFDFAGYFKSAKSCSNAVDTASYYFRANSAGKSHYIEHHAPCDNQANDRQFQQFEKTVLAVLKPQHYGFFTAEFSGPHGCKIPDPRKTSDSLNSSGSVGLILDINENGQVLASRIYQSSGFKVLDRATQDGIKRCRFLPARYLDKPIASTLKTIYVWRDKE